MLLNINHYITLTEECPDFPIGYCNLPGRIFFLDEVRALSQWCDGNVMTGLSSLRHLHDVIACGLYAVSTTEKVVLAHT